MNNKLSKQCDARFIQASIARGWTVRFLARKFHGTVEQVHKAAGCVSGERCNGAGCRVNG